MSERRFPLGAAVSEAALCAEMARVAYVQHEQPGGQARLAKYLARAQFSAVDHLNGDGTQGFAADRLTAEGELIRVIAFRGTEPGDLRDLLADLKAWPAGWPQVKDMTDHAPMNYVAPLMGLP